MKILLAIPSKNRVDILGKFTYQWLKDLPFDWRIFVEPQDEQEYVACFGRIGVVCLGEDNRGLSYSAKCIKTYAKQNNYDLVFKIDDDVKSFTGFREKGSIDRTVELLKEKIEIFIKWFEEKPNLGAIAFPYSFQMFEKQECVLTKRIQSCYVARTELFTPDDYEFQVFQDFATGINCLLKGKKIVKYNLLGQDLGIAVGKESSPWKNRDRETLARQDCDNLRKLYPPIAFRRVDKPWKIEPDLRSIKL